MNIKLRTEARNYFEKDFFYANEQRSFWKNYGKC